MITFFKIIITIIFCLLWGQLQHGCQQGAKASGSAIGYLLVNILGLVLLVAGIYGIWKYKPTQNATHNGPQKPNPPKNYQQGHYDGGHNNPNNSNNQTNGGYTKQQPNSGEYQSGDLYN